MAKLTQEPIPFTQIANAVLNDKELSWKAKGLFAYLFSKPATWNFAGDRIVLDGTDGRDSVFSGLRELEKKGYLKRVQVVGRRVEYILRYSTTFAENPQTTSAENPDVGKIRRVSNKDTSTNKEDIFSWEKSREKMMEKEGSDMDIIATFLEERKIVPKNGAELTGYIKRYRKVAQDVAPFVGPDFARFWKAVEICKEESYRLGYTWDLNTVYKKITKI